MFKENKPILPKSAFVSDIDLNQSINVFIRVRKKNKLVIENYDYDKLGSLLPKRKKHFKIEELELKYGADINDVAKIKAYVNDYNIIVLETDLVLRTVVLSGKIKHFNDAFKIRLTNYTYGKRLFRSYNEEIQIPLELHGIINGIFGLDTQWENETAGFFISNMENLPEPGLNDVLKRYSPQMIRNSYNFPKESFGKGESIGIISLGGGYKFDDIKYFLNIVEKVRVPKITDISVLGVQNNPGIDLNADFEIIMDLEIISSLANEAEIGVYFAPNTEQGVIQAFHNAIFDKKRRNSVISMSWGKPEFLCKQSFIKEINLLFEAAALLGITICLPSGNSGSGNPSGTSEAFVEFPASSPYALCCGGTKFILKDEKIIKEVVWKEYAFNRVWATGGGVSDIFSDIPKYQLDAGIKMKSINRKKNYGRAIPDVSSVAGTPGYNIYINKKPALLPGAETSVSAPLWAALIAILNSKLGNRIGYFHPLLYREAPRGKAFNDITIGDNINSRSGGYHAQSGWDACTGWGSPNGEELLKLFRGEI